MKTTSRSGLAKLKRAALYVLVFPQVVIHKLKGIDGTYDDLATFFRYFPFGRINNNRTISVRCSGQAVTFFYGHLNPISGGVFGNRVTRVCQLLGKWWSILVRRLAIPLSILQCGERSGCMVTS